MLKDIYWGCGPTIRLEINITPYLPQIVIMYNL